MIYSKKFQKGLEDVGHNLVGPGIFPNLHHLWFFRCEIYFNL